MERTETLTVGVEKKAMQRSGNTGREFGNQEAPSPKGGKCDKKGKKSWAVDLGTGECRVE